MKTKYTVTPFHPCNDKDRAAGVVAGWDVRDENNLAVECFDDKDQAERRCAELNEPKLPAGYYVTSIVRGNTRTWIVATDEGSRWIVSGQDSEKTAIRRACALIEGKPIDYYLTL